MRDDGPSVGNGVGRLPLGGLCLMMCLDVVGVEGVGGVMQVQGVVGGGIPWAVSRGVVLLPLCEGRMPFP